VTTHRVGVSSVLVLGSVGRVAESLATSRVLTQIRLFTGV